jgi:hypothetical protein
MFGQLKKEGISIHHYQIIKGHYMRLDIFISFIVKKIRKEVSGGIDVEVP